MQKIFITGLYRSGTTLLEKVLNLHPSLHLFSQPFPNLYLETKKKFYIHKGLNKIRLLDHLFLEQDYSRDDFCGVLDSCVFSTQDVDRLFDAMATYSGQQTPELLPLRLQIRPGSFFQLYEQLFSSLAENLAKNQVGFLGAKEIICEEFIPFLLSKGEYAIVIIRDPRDVVTSLNFGQGSSYMGKIRPILYTLRQWRKSVSFCLEYQDRPNFAYLRYEDLVKDPGSILNWLTQFLRLIPYPRDIFADGIVDQAGQRWQGNSSFGNYSFISRDSVANFTNKLPEDCVRYIENVCNPELRYLNYEFIYHESGPDFDEIRSFKESFKVDHNDFEAHYTHQPRRIENEIKRLRYLNSQLSEAEQKLWFIFPRAYQDLRAII